MLRSCLPLDVEPLRGLCCTKQKSLHMQPARSLSAWPSLHKIPAFDNQKAEHFFPVQLVPHTQLGGPALNVTYSLLGMQQVRELRTLHEERQRDTRLRLLAWQEEVRLRLRAELEARQQEWQTELEARSRKEAADLTRKLQVGGVPQGSLPRRLVLCSDRTPAALHYRGGQCWDLTRRREVVGKLPPCRGSSAATGQRVVSWHRLLLPHIGHVVSMGMFAQLCRTANGSTSTPWQTWRGFGARWQSRSSTMRSWRGSSTQRGAAPGTCITAAAPRRVDDAQTLLADMPLITAHAVTYLAAP